MKARELMLGIGLLCAGSPLLFCPLEPEACAEEVTRIIAKVNNQIITSKDLDDYCRSMVYRSGSSLQDVSCQDPRVRQQVLDRLIQDRLILDEAQKDNIEVPVEWVDENLEKVISSFPTRKDFEDSLSKKGLTITGIRGKLKDQYRIQYIIEREIKSVISISPQEISLYYKNNPGKCYSAPKYLFYIAESESYSSLREISDLIAQEGIEAAHQKYAGELNRVEADKYELLEEISGFLSQMSEQECNIKDIGDKFYLLYLKDAVPACLLELDQVKERIYSYLLQEKYNARLKDWVEGLKKKAVIQICE
jgi:hypothetical protein